MLEVKSFVWKQDKALNDSFFPIHFALRSKLGLKSVIKKKRKMPHGCRGVGLVWGGQKKLEEIPRPIHKANISSSNISNNNSFNNNFDNNNNSSTTAFYALYDVDVDWQQEDETW